MKLLFFNEDTNCQQLPELTAVQVWSAFVTEDPGSACNKPIVKNPMTTYSRP